jgi:hypothetical protein
MVTAAIVINQTGKPPGVPSQSRDDLDLGSAVFLTNDDDTSVLTWFWEFVSKPVGSASVISGSASPAASFVPDVRGSYLVQLTVDGFPSSPSTDARIAAVKTAFLAIRKPATHERQEFDATDGWSRAQQAMIDAIDSDAANSLKLDGSNQPTADIDWGARKITNMSGLQNEGPMRLGEISDPVQSSDHGFVYAKDSSGNTELFYMDDSGAVVQVTKDGRLNSNGLWEAGGTFLPIGAVQDGQVLIRNGPSITGTVLETGGKVKIRVDDESDGYLHEKLLTGPGLKFSIGNPGGDETLTIDAYGELKLDSGDTTLGYLRDKLLTGPALKLSVDNIGGNEALVVDAYGELKTSATDTTLGYLFDKLSEGVNISLTRQNPGGDENILITCLAKGGTVKVRVDDTADGYLHDKLLTGSGLKFAIGNPGGNETLTIDAYGELKLDSGDTTFGYLRDKLLTGPGLKHSVGNPGGDETFTIDAYGELKLDSVDTTFGYLRDKLLTGPGLKYSIGTPGGNETLTIDAYGELKVDSSDTTFGYLYDKLTAGNNIRFTKQNIGANENILVSTVGSITGGKVKVRVDDTADGYLHDKLLTGPGLKFAIGSPGGNETLTIDAYGQLKNSASDTAFDYLSAKLVAGSNVTLATLNPGSNETLRVSAFGTNSTDVPIVLHSSTDAYGVFGMFSMDSADYTGIIFKATGYVTSPTMSGTVVLYNLTDSSVVTYLTFNSVTAAEQDSTALSLPSGKKVYDVRLNPINNGGPGSGNLLVVDWAGFRGTGGGAKADIPIVLHTSTDGYATLGEFSFDPGDYAGNAISFKATGFVTLGGMTGTVILYNKTDSSIVTYLTFTSLVPGEQISATLSLPAGKKVYDVRLNPVGGGGFGSGNLLDVEWAGMQIR